MSGKIAFLHRFEGEPRQMSDDALLAACAKGDTVALGALFDRFYPDVYRFIFRMSGCDASDLDDLVQTSFLEVQRSASRFLGKSAVRSWIFGICANVVRHHVRSEVRRKKLTAAYATLPPPTERSPHDEMERQEQMDRLAAGLNRLSHKLRVAFVMCDVEGISGVEAARMLGLRQGTLWRRLHEARKALAASIEGRHVP